MKELLTTLSIPLSWLALPTLLIWAYDKWVAAPNRPRDEKGEPAPGPLYARVAEWLLPFVLVAVVLRIGVSVVFGWAKEFAVPLSGFALPVGLWCAIDSWLLAPRRQIAAGSAAIKDPPLVRAAYTLLPVLVVAVIVRLISAETLDFSLVLLVLSLATGAVWLVDHLVFRKQREAAMLKGVGGEVTLPEPGTVDYARSFFPVAFIVLIVRAFIFEPFRIPSDSMMPTLLDGDFIVVNKFAYGLRWPVINEKFIDLGSPQRGDVVVFRHPPHPEVNFIKRLVGLPGDHVEIHDDHLVINGETIPLEDKGRYTDGCYVGLRLSTENIGAHTHQVMSCRTSQSWVSTPGTGLDSESGLPACDRKGFNEKYGRLRCVETPPNEGPDANDHVGGWKLGVQAFEQQQVEHRLDVDVVPAGFYLMIGDNRDNSDDSRGWGLVPDKNLVGKATRIWFNFDLQRSGVVNWSRIGKSID